LIILNR
jgi:predicted RNA-binding protein YlqC (UPF0109 family)